MRNDNLTNDVVEKDQDLYYSKVQGGQQLYKLIESKNVDEITLSKENDKSLEIVHETPPCDRC